MPFEWLIRCEAISKQIDIHNIRIISLLLSIPSAQACIQRDINIGWPIRKIKPGMNRFKICFFIFVIFWIYQHFLCLIQSIPQLLPVLKVQNVLSGPMCRWWYKNPNLHWTQSPTGAGSGAGWQIPKSFDKSSCHWNNRSIHNLLGGSQPTTLRCGSSVHIQRSWIGNAKSAPIQTTPTSTQQCSRFR